MTKPGRGRPQAIVGFHQDEVHDCVAQPAVLPALLALARRR